MKTRTRLAAIASAVALALSGTACSSSSSSSGPATEATKNLEVVSWWTSGSEQQALNVLFDAYKSAHSDVTVANATVSGGGGSNAQVVLAQRLLAGDAPDVWQTFPGGALRSFVGQNQVSDVSAIYAQNGLSGALPKVILEGLTINGKQYGVPTSAHRGNVLFYNTELLKKAGVAKPSSGYTVKAFLGDLATLKKAGVTPLCLGAKDLFTTPAMFENVLLSMVGPSGWTQISKDRFDWNSGQVKQALDDFGTMLDNADPEAAALSWDAATKKLASGGCAFETINDSAFGELTRAGAADGKDFGAIPFPGTDSSYVAVVDTFVQAKSAKDSRNATDFLAGLGAPQTQVAFSKVKGSVPVRTDADVSKLTSYQQSAAQALRKGTVIWSIVHGSATSPRFQQGFYDAVSTFVRSRNADAFSKTLTSAMGRQPPSK